MAAAAAAAAAVAATAAEAPQLRRRQNVQFFFYFSNFRGATGPNMFDVATAQEAWCGGEEVAAIGEDHSFRDMPTHTHTREHDLWELARDRRWQRAYNLLWLGWSRLGWRSAGSCSCKAPSDAFGPSGWKGPQKRMEELEMEVSLLNIIVFMF